MLIRIHLRHHHRNLAIAAAAVFDKSTDLPGHPQGFRSHMPARGNLQGAVSRHRFGRVIRNKVRLQRRQRGGLGKPPRFIQHNRLKMFEFTSPHDSQQLAIRLFGRGKQRTRVKFVFIVIGKVNGRRIQTERNRSVFADLEHLDQQIPLLNAETGKPIHPQPRPPQERGRRNHLFSERQFRIRVFKPAFSRSEKGMVCLKNSGDIRPLRRGQFLSRFGRQCLRQRANLFRVAIGVLQLRQQIGQFRGQSHPLDVTLIQGQLTRQFQQNLMQNHLFSGA